jgi:hypothetical protein
MTSRLARLALPTLTLAVLLTPVDVEAQYRSRPYEERIYVRSNLAEPRWDFLAGSYIATVTAEVQADGTIEFPRTVITQP